MRRFLVVVLACSFSALSVAGSHAGPPAGSLTATVSARAEAAGLDPERLLSTTVSVQRRHADGSGDAVVVTLRDLLADLDRAGTREAPGILGTPEVMVGDTLHVYASVGTGNQLGYAVSTSAVVPATPPVVLPPPATPLFFDVGGPLVNIKGSYQTGFHTAGTVVGSNVDTADPGNGDPVYLPGRSSGVVDDSSVDFVGHAVVAQAQTCVFLLRRRRWLPRHRRRPVRQHPAGRPSGRALSEGQPAAGTTPIGPVGTAGVNRRRGSTMYPAVVASTGRENR